MTSLYQFYLADPTFNLAFDPDLIEADTYKEGHRRAVLLAKQMGTARGYKVYCNGRHVEDGVIFPSSRGGRGS